MLHGILTVTAKSSSTMRYRTEPGLSFLFWAIFKSVIIKRGSIAVLISYNISAASIYVEKQASASKGHFYSSAYD